MNHYLNKNRHTSVAYRLGVAMQKKRIDGRTLASRSGVSESSISGYLNSHSFPTRCTVERLSAVLGVSTNWLLGVAPFEVEEEDRLSEESFLNLYRSLTDKHKAYLLETALLLHKVQDSE